MCFCASCLLIRSSPSHQVSFSSPARLVLLSEHLQRLGLDAHLHCVGGDPGRGAEARFVCIMMRKGNDRTPYTPSDLTCVVLGRLCRTGSLVDDDDREAADPYLSCREGCTRGADIVGLVQDMKAARTRAVTQQAPSLFD